MGGNSFILDFDGVICDTRAECLITSFSAYQKLLGSFPQEVFSSEIIPIEERIKFYNFRYSVRVAADFKLLWDIIRSGRTISSRLPLREQTDVDLDELHTYHKLFYQQRLLWMQQDRASWLADNPLYPGIAPKISQWVEGGQMLIASAKNKKAILEIMRYHHIRIPDEFVFSMEAGDKPFHYRQIAEQRRQSTIHFIDDHLGNLLLAKETGFKLHLATWGYTSQEFERQAILQGINLLSLDGFISL